MPTPHQHSVYSRRCETTPGRVHLAIVAATSQLSRVLARRILSANRPTPPRDCTHPSVHAAQVLSDVDRPIHQYEHQTPGPRPRPLRSVAPGAALLDVCKREEQSVSPQRQLHGTLLSPKARRRPNVCVLLRALSWNASAQRTLPKLSRSSAATHCYAAPIGTIVALQLRTVARSSGAQLIESARREAPGPARQSCPDSARS